MKKSIFLIIAIWTCIHTACANDGVYFTSGNFLVPIQETDIKAAKEILTITIGGNGFASVDVYYEFMNNGEPKTVKMAFEASSSYNDEEPLHRNGVHPHIKDFTVHMNGEALPFKNGVVAFRFTNDKRETDFTPLDMTKWKGVGEVPDSILPFGDAIYNAELDSATAYAYAYYFDAPFKKGLNIVHHTYKYRMSYNVMEKFTIPYWLTPVTRWANHQADDFTLRINTEESTEFCMADTLFRTAPFTSAKGCEIYHLTDDYGSSSIFAQLMPDDTISWHSTNFRPNADMCIKSPEWASGSNWRKYRTSGKVVIEADGHKSRYIAICGDSYLVDVQDYGLVKKAGSKVELYDAANGQGILIQNSEEAKRVNVRRRPTTKSSIICTISDTEGELPTVYPCLGYSSGSDDGMWYKTKVNGKIGYIRQDLMLWDAIDTY